MLNWFVRRPRILTVGSVLIDTVAVRHIELPIKHFFAPGEITTSLGGCSYNIAINLGLLDVPGGVGMFTYLPADTATTRLALSRLERLGVSTVHVHETDNLGDPPLPELQVKTGGFVGTRDPRNHELRIYAVQEFLGEHDFLALKSHKTKFVAAMEKANAVVVDCGLHVGTIQSIIKLCRDKGVPVLVHIVSSIKAENYWESAVQLGLREKLSDRIFCVSGKPKEIGRLLEMSGLQSAEAEQFTANCVSLTKPLPIPEAEVCERLGARNVLITPERPTDGRVRWALISDGFHFRDEFNVGEQKVQNFLGLSEATAAAFVYSAVTAGKLRRGRAKTGMVPVELLDHKDLYIQSVKNAAYFALLSPGATPDSVIVEKDIESKVLPRRVRSRVIWNKVVSWATSLQALYSALATLGVWNLMRWLLNYFGVW
jgi:hypothetical protein